MKLKKLKKKISRRYKTWEFLTLKTCNWIVYCNMKAFELLRKRFLNLIYKRISIIFIPSSSCSHLLFFLLVLFPFCSVKNLVLMLLLLLLMVLLYGIELNKTMNMNIHCAVPCCTLYVCLCYKFMFKSMIIMM